MKIGITTRTFNSSTNAKLNAVPSTYINIINEDNFPIIIDNNIDAIKNKEYLLNLIKDIDGFILGGGDETSEVDMFIIDYCYKNDIPLLGICLGMQEIALYFNEKGLKKLNNLSHFDMNSDYLHTVKLNKKGYLYNLLKQDSIPVNSRHKYCVLNNKNFVIEGKCDNVIEAFKVKQKKYILGVQCHPEIMYFYDNNAKQLFNDFFKACSKK